MAIIEREILEAILAQGFLGIIFSYLLFYVLKENSKREQNYQKLVIDITKILPVIKNDIDDIKKKIMNSKNKDE